MLVRQVSLQTVKAVEFAEYMSHHQVDTEESQADGDCPSDQICGRQRAIMAAKGNLWTRLRQNLLLLSYLLLSAIIVVYLYSSYQEDKNRYLEDIRAQDHFTQNNIQQRIIVDLNNGINDLGFFASFFSRHSGLASGVTSPFKNSDEALASVYNEFLSYLAFKKLFSSIALFDRLGQLKMQVSFEQGLPIMSHAESMIKGQQKKVFEQLAVNRDTRIHISLAEDESSGHFLQLAVAIIDDNNFFAGVVMVRYPMSRIGSVLGELIDGKAGKLLLLDTAGQLLFGDDPQLAANLLENSSLPGAFSQTEHGHGLGRQGYYDWQLTRLSENMSKIDSGVNWISLLYRSSDSVESDLTGLRQAYLMQGFLYFIFLASSLYVINIYRDRELEEEKTRQILQEGRIFTAQLLAGAISNDSLEKEMQMAIENILELSWLNVLAKGSIFIADDSGDLVMVAEKDLAKPLLTSCAVIRPGQCLCGRAASTRQTVFKNCLDHEHEITFEGITEHGHICMPIMKGDKVLGVLNLYVEHGQEMKPIHEDILKNITAALASVIENKSTREELIAAHHEIVKQHEQLEYERSVVEDTLLRIRSSERFDTENIRYLEASVEKTAGDILLSGKSKDGRHYYFLGDFTGHGLASALSGPTVADIFYAMTSKGFDAGKILQTINEKLFRTLPVHLYLAACMVECNGEDRSFRIWNAGLPPALLFSNGHFRQHFESRFLPLGIIVEQDFAAGAMTIQAGPGDRIYVYSDGITEAPNLYEEMYGEDRFIGLLTRILAENLSLDDVLKDVRVFTRHTPQADDITLLEINSPSSASV